MASARKARKATVTKADEPPPRLDVPPDLLAAMSGRLVWKRWCSLDENRRQEILRILAATKDPQKRDARIVETVRMLGSNTHSIRGAIAHRETSIVSKRGT